MSASSISTIITVPLIRAKVLGVRFGTPIPTQVKIYCHLTEGFRLEYIDGSSAEEVAKLFPEVVLEARLELMRTLKKRAGITTSYHKRTTQILSPVQAVEPLPRFLREAKAVDGAPVTNSPSVPSVIPAVPALSGAPSLPMTRGPSPLPIAMPIAQPAAMPIAQSVAPLPIARPAGSLPIAQSVEYAAKRDLGTEFMAVTGHFSLFDHLIEPAETKAVALPASGSSPANGSSVFAVHDKTPKRLAALRAARLRGKPVSDLTPTRGA